MDIIENIIKNKNIKIVSFDIFDTLIERPCIYPSDVFSLLNGKENKINNKDFYDIRKVIEKEIIDGGNNNPNIYEIYDFLAKKYNIAKDKKEYLLNLELELEYNILKERKFVKELYNLAFNEGKKIICVSDMYLPSDIIKNILIKNDYKDINNIYVSCELKKRKDDGNLFKYVLTKEKVLPHEILHIGDNKISDFDMPVKQGITAYHIQSSVNDFFNSKITKEFSSIYKDKDKYSPSERVLLGFSINKFMENKNSIKKNMLFSSPYSIGYNILGPFLFSLCLYIMNNKYIQNNYSCIHFASRDGYLPMKAYDILTKDSENYLKSKYIYAGRTTYYIGNYRGNILKYLTNDKIKDGDYNIKNLFLSKIGEDFIDILEKDNFDLNTLFFEDYDNGFILIKSIVNKYSQEIKEILNKKRIEASHYYNNILKFNNGRALIFDIGYSGSISNCIGKLTNKKIDKIYIWNTDSNKNIDKKNKTKTYLLHNGFNLEYCNILFEELFSPLQGQIKSLDNNKILFYDEVFSEKMKQDLELIQKASIDFITDINVLLGKYKSIFCFITNDLFYRTAKYIISSKTDTSINNLQNISFIDTFYYGNKSKLSLYEKLKSQKHSFYKSRFLDSNLMKNINNCIEITDKKIAIHIHVFYIDILYEIIDYLKEAPIEFDLLISVVSEKNKNICFNLLNKSILPKLNKLIIKVAINRGRDIAPWLIYFKEEQNNYDYICHIHTKNSNYVDFAKDWRNYLYRNLINKDSLLDILDLFESDDNIGVIFPTYYDKLYNFKFINNVYIYKDDEDNINKLLYNMGIKTYVSESSILFSGGSMFWYRPNALKKLFDLNLSYYNFEKEPIPNKGTLAHAIERLPVLVAEASGYKISFYLNRQELIDFYFKKNYIDTLFINNGKNIEYYKLKSNWFTLFGISNNRDTLRITLFGIKISIKMTPEKIDKIAWWIPFKKLRNKFRRKMLE